MPDRSRTPLAPVWARLRRVLAAVAVLGFASTSLACTRTGRPEPLRTRQLPQLPTQTTEPIRALAASPLPALLEGQPTAEIAGVPLQPSPAPTVAEPADLAAATHLPSPELPPPTPSAGPGAVTLVPTLAPTATPLLEPTATPVVPTETPPPDATADPGADRAEELLDELLNLLDGADPLDDLLD